MKRRSGLLRAPLSVESDVLPRWSRLNTTVLLTHNIIIYIIYDTICDSWISFHAQALDVGRTGACSRGPDSGLVSCFVLSLSLWIFLAAFFPVRPCLWTFHWTSCSLGFLCNPLSLPAFAPRASWDSACSLHRCAS